MRFLPHEHADVTEALSAHGIDVGTVLFVKRRGRLHVQIPGHAGTFAFFRKKVTKLDTNGKWEDRTDYYLGNVKADGIGISWEEVLGSFRTWLGERAFQTQQRSTA